MSLRVLLADESPSIRKVFQLGLQDFGAEVKSVHNGLDVVEVAETFQPDIIFADILLQKRNGYEVSKAIQVHGKLFDVPVVLMWSSFMELDQGQYAQSGAKGELEKPFDVEQMRKLIQSLVKKTQSQKISDFLSFPENITEAFVEESNQRHNTQETANTPPPVPTEEAKPPAPAVDFSLDEEVESKEPEVEPNSVFNAQLDEEFSMYEVNADTPPIEPEITRTSETATSEEEAWQPQPLQANTVTPPPPETTDEQSDGFESVEISSDESKPMDLKEFLYQPDHTNTKTEEGIRTDEHQISNVKITPDSQHEIQNVMIPHDHQGGQASPISFAEQEHIIRSEVRKYLVENIKNQLPPLLEKIIREELEKIMEQEMAIKGASPTKLMITDYIKEAFAEDIPDGDITTASLGKPEKFGIAQLLAKQDLVLSGRELFEKSLKFVSTDLKVGWNFKDGDEVLNQQIIAQIEGNLVELLKAERVALNFLGYLSGIATTTSQYVKACGNNKTKILDTRKTLPLYREVSKKAVLDGGGSNHRMNLSDAILIKENHINISGDLKTCVESIKSNTELAIEVEVKSLDELKEALECGVERVMLDNMSNEEMAQCLAVLPEDVESEASGNMTLERISSVAELGVDFISVGALTHSVKNADISLLFDWT